MKGLLRNVLGLILAILGILIIMYGVYQLYKVFVNQDIEKAKHALDVLEAKVKALDEMGSGANLNVTLIGPDTWMLYAWNAEDRNAPDRCYFSSCLCACPSLLPSCDVVLQGQSKDVLQQAKEICQDKGICRSMPEKNIILRSHILPLIDPVTERPSISPIILFCKNFIEIRITKQEKSYIFDNDRINEKYNSEISK